MPHQHPSDWEMLPIEDGSTGQAFMGIRQNERVFFKRNTSPFIATLSAEGIAPKLIWTQRTYSGDVLTAQEWTDGTLLSHDDMATPKVVDLIRRIHTSHYLLSMLQRVQGAVFKPLDFIQFYLHQLSPSLKKHHFFNEVLHFLEEQMDDDFYRAPYVVCHGDLNHHNFLLSTHQHLYLVDWENVRIADPLSDITWLLCQYFPPSQWMDWFDTYGFPIDASFYKRTQWYSLMNCLLLVKHYHAENRLVKMNEVILLLKSIYAQATSNKKEPF